ncbi:hypothetical protein [Telmatospirillum siberiense]|nr:hypothetical protein [Telmatospirillum siberiense]
MFFWPRSGCLATAVTAAVMLAGCAEDPYLSTDYRYHQRGVVQVCINEDTASIADAKKLADETCRPFDRTSKLALIQRYQCSWTAPTLVAFSCVARPGETPPPFAEHLSPMRHDPSLGAQ